MPAKTGADVAPTNGSQQTVYSPTEEEKKEEKVSLLVWDHVAEARLTEVGNFPVKNPIGIVIVFASTTD